ncbi:hypothetical protein D3C72_1755940 [compost metagenome]
MHHLPELRFPPGEILDFLFVTLDAINPEILAADEHCHFGPGMAGDGQLMQYLTLVSHRHPFLPLGGAVIAGGLDLQNARPIGMADHLSVEVGEHEGLLGVLQYRIDPAHLVACALGIDLCQHRFELNAPQHRFLMGDIFRLLPAGLLQPQAERAFVRG